jgi:hypothetical protein
MNEIFAPGVVRFEHLKINAIKWPFKSLKLKLNNFVQEASDFIQSLFKLERILKLIFERNGN